MSTRNCQVEVGPPVFVFQNTTFQTAANSIYVNKQNFDANPTNSTKNRVYTFKTDFERMQYLLGLYGRTSTGQR
jgi:hypothetical protein